ncbi:unnamed protein product, partial [Adineta steineri]
MSVDSNAVAPSNSIQPNKNLGSIDNLRDNQDDTLTSVLTSLAGTIKDFTESPYFPKMAFKKIPS